MPVNYEARRKRAKKLLREHNVDAWLITAEKNVTYLTGFSGDSTYLLMTQDAELALSDFRYITQLAEECPGLETSIRTSGETMLAAISAALNSRKISRLGIEGHVLTVESFQRFQQSFEGVELVAIDWQIEELRAIKDSSEIEEIRQAVTLAERGFEFLKAILTPAATERKLAYELEHAIRNFGGAGVSFPPIIAVGDRAALPHYRPQEYQVSSSPILLVDWGAQTHAGYKSDITRTVLTRKADKKFEKVYKTVLEAQRLAIEKIAPGVACDEVDAAAREHIAQAGFGKYFGHGLGHGIGLDIHELPRFSQISETTLKPGMVVTVEPGIYLPGWGGVRIEDDVLVTKNGHEVLTSVPKDWDTVQVNC